MATRREVAREAAKLIYNGTVKEYKDAKEMAATSLGSNSLPSNYEIAKELDDLAELIEGSERLSELIERRQIALEVMKKLEKYNPSLIGSVWRGTARKGSDIDIVIYHDSPGELPGLLSYPVKTFEHKEFKIGETTRRSTHITLQVDKYMVELVVRPTKDREYYRGERCDIFGDVKRGIDITGLERVIQVDPLRRFIPKRRAR